MILPVQYSEQENSHNIKFETLNHHVIKALLLNYWLALDKILHAYHFWEPEKCNAFI